MKDPDHIVFMKLKPNSRTLFFECPISINSLGFRGEEIGPKSGNTFRIVALGESTTFGCTLRSTDKPWPAMLQRELQENLPYPVEVVNAGVPSYSILENLRRFERDIVPLKPDLIVCYHGYNGFSLLDKRVPPVTGRQPPVYVSRPIRLLADAEHRLRMLRYRRSFTQPPRLEKLDTESLLSSRYAQAYESLITKAQSRGIKVALVTFSLAVDGNSSRELIEFYRGAFPGVHQSIHLNAVHNQLLQLLVRKHPDVLLADASPKLNGRHELFIDLMHLTDEARSTLATKIGEVLEPAVVNLPNHD